MTIPTMKHSGTATQGYGAANVPMVISRAPLIANPQ